VIALKPGALSGCCADLGVSREALSRQMGVSPTTLYRLDRGDSVPSARLIGLLMQVTGRPFEALFDVDGPDGPGGQSQGPGGLGGVGER